MSKEYKAYRFFVMVYVLLIANFAVGISDGISYYLWFCSSITFLSVLLIKEKDKLLDLIKHPAVYTFSGESIYLLAFLISYPRHYQLSRHLDYGYVVLLQLINVLLFIAIFCVKRRSVEPEKG